MTFRQPLFHCVREGLIVILETCITPSGDFVNDSRIVIAELDVELDIVSLLTTWSLCAVNDYLAVANLANELFITCHEISGSICREAEVLNIAANLYLELPEVAEVVDYQKVAAEQPAGISSVLSMNSFTDC